MTDYSGPSEFLKSLYAKRNDPDLFLDRSLIDDVMYKNGYENVSDLESAVHLVRFSVSMILSSDDTRKYHTFLNNLIKYIVQQGKIIESARYADAVTSIYQSLMLINRGDEIADIALHLNAFR